MYEPPNISYYIGPFNMVINSVGVNASRLGFGIRRITKKTLKNTDLKYIDTF